MSCVGGKGGNGGIGGTGAPGLHEPEYSMVNKFEIVY